MNPENEPVPVTTKRIETRTIVEIAVLFSIPVLLAGIHAATTEATRTRFYFYLTEPSLVTAWTGTVVHSSWSHVEANVVAYLLATLTAYAMYVKWGRQRVMWIIFTAVLVTTPPVQSLIDYAVITVQLDAAGPESHTKGFSGVVGGFTGMLIATISAYVAHRTNTTIGTNTLLIMFFLASGIIFTVYTPSGHVLIISAGLLLLGLSITTRSIVVSLGVRGFIDVRERVNAAFWDVVLVYTATVIALMLVYLSFPSDPAAGETTANIIAHLTGIVYGFLITTFTLRSYDEARVLREKVMC